MKIGVELEFFICHKSDETFYMPDIISRYLKYNSGFISMQKDSNGMNPLLYFKYLDIISGI